MNRLKEKLVVSMRNTFRLCDVSHLVNLVDIVTMDNGIMNTLRMLV